MRISDWSSDVCSSDLGGARYTPPPVTHYLTYSQYNCQRNIYTNTRGLRAPGINRARSIPPHLDGEASRGSTVPPRRQRGSGRRSTRGSRRRRHCRSEEHTYELQSLMRSSYAVLCLKKTTTNTTHSPRTG